jgi:hypothetical protein
MPDEPASSGRAQPAEEAEHPAAPDAPGNPEASGALKTPAPSQDPSAPVSPGALIGWAEISNPAWKPSFTREQAGLAVAFTGKCPSCTHDTMFSVPFARPDLTAPTVRGGLATTFTMYCECGYPHPGHPDGDNSCGAYWPYEAQL